MAGGFFYGKMPLFSRKVEVLEKRVEDFRKEVEVGGE